MNKLLLEVYLPASGISYEMRIPKQLKVAQVTEMIRQYLLMREEGEYVPTEDAVLCDGETGKIYDANLFLDSLNLANGKRVIFI